MAIVLLPGTDQTNIQSEAQILLGFLLWMVNPAVIPTPTMANVKAALEVGQPFTWDDASFRQVINRAYSLPIDQSLLSAHEISAYNEMFVYLEPDPTQDCCGVETVDAGNTTLEVTVRVGSGTFERALLLKLDSDTDCNVFDCQITIIPTGGAPAATVSPVVANKLGCINGERQFKFLWSDFVGNPSGKTYDFDLDFRDELGSSLYTFGITGVVLP